MPSITVGLAPRKFRYFDQKTNRHFTLNNPVQTIIFDETVDLGGIAHAILCKDPRLVIYEGALPTETIEAWEDKYKGIFNTKVDQQYRDLTGNMVYPVANGALDRSAIQKGKEPVETPVEPTTPETPEEPSTPEEPEAPPEEEVEVQAQQVSAKAVAVEEEAKVAPKATRKAKTKDAEKK